ncbi:MAG: Terminase-like family protein, partial [Ruminiclostridium sp.]|nr:Terminase-like family protein [Ruminiclostridium sp.]
PMTPIVDTYTVYDPSGKQIKINKSRIFIPASVFDNQKLLSNDPEYLASLAMLPEAEKNALLYGDWDSFSGQVFSEWVDDKVHYEDRQWTHVIAPFRIPKDWTVVRGFDFGYAKPFSVGWYAVDRRGCIYRIAEYYGCTETANTGIMINPVEIAAEIKRIES